MVFVEKTNTPCVVFGLQLLFFLCVCALVCECNVCLFSCLPACALSVSRLHLSAVFAFRLFTSAFYAWELENSSMLKLSPVLSASRHGCSTTQPITGQRREMAHGFSTQKSCVELSLQRCSSTFFLRTSCLVNVQPLEAHFARLLSMMHKGSCHSLQILMFSIQEVVTLGKKKTVCIHKRAWQWLFWLYVL